MVSSRARGGTYIDRKSEVNLRSIIVELRSKTTQWIDDERIVRGLDEGRGRLSGEDRECKTRVNGGRMKEGTKRRHSQRRKDESVRDSA